MKIMYVIIDVPQLFDQILAFELFLCAWQMHGYIVQTICQVFVKLVKAVLNTSQAINTFITQVVW